MNQSYVYFKLEVQSTHSKTIMLSSITRVLLALSLCFLSAVSLRYGSSRSFSNKAADGSEPLFLSKYLDDPETGRNLALVNQSVVSQESYSGYFTVSEKLGSNMYFWFFPAQNGDKDAPILLWLQGGPGGSSLYGLFAENGPLTVKSDLTLEAADVTWNSKYHMLYIDNPVGTGFSFTDGKAGLSTNEDEVAANLFSCLTQFFTIFDEYSSNDFYITGESYAGKYIPAISYYIHTMNSDPAARASAAASMDTHTRDVAINLVGLAIGDGLTDPYNMVGAYSDMLFNLGLVDVRERTVVEDYQTKIMAAIARGDMLEGFNLWDRLLNGDLCNCTPYVANVTGSGNYFNVMFEMFDYSRGDFYGQFVSQPHVRAALNVGDRTYADDSDEVEVALVNDIMVSVAPLFPTLLDNYQVLLYSGQLDLIVGAPLTERFLSNLEWSGADALATAQKRIWMDGDGSKNVAGYARKANNLWQVIVREAGHMVPQDQPVRAFDMLQRFISGEGW